MDRRQMCVSNVRYKRPTADEAKRMKQLLGYLTYRDSRDQGVKLAAGQERWVDHGMGGSVAEIARRCDDLRSDHVLTFSLVINPNPGLVAMIPREQREQFVCELTENTVDGFCAARGLDTGCEYSYVTHHRLTDDPQDPGQHNPHTHVVLPGTVWSEEHGERVNLYFSQRQKADHIALLHEVTEAGMADLLDQYVGPDWEQRYDALEAIREAQLGITAGEPHGYHRTDAGERVPFWGGARQVDEARCAVGYYLPVADEDGAVSIRFRPVAGGLEREYAEQMATVVGGGLHEYPHLDQLALYREVLNGLLAEGDFDLGPEQPAPPPAPDFDR